MQAEHASQQRRKEKVAVHDPRASADTVASVPLTRIGALFPACCCPTADTHPLFLVPLFIDRPLTSDKSWFTIKRPSWECRITVV